MAIEMFEKSTEIDTNYAPAWVYLGASYTSDAAFELGGREQYRRAQAAYERALAIKPNLLDAQMFSANLVLDTGKVEQAVALLREALNTKGNYAAAHWELGYAYRFAGMLDESVAECELARQLDPLVKTNGSVLNTYFYLGQYQKFLESLPVDDSSFILFYRGFGEFHKKNFDRLRKTLIALTNSIPLCMRESARLSATPSTSAKERDWISWTDWRGESESEESVIQKRPTRSRKHVPSWETKSPLYAS